MKNSSHGGGRRAWRIALAATLALATAPVLVADDATPTAAEPTAAEPATAELAVAEAPAPAAAAGAAVVRWNPVSQAMEAPAAEARAELARRLQEVLAAELAKRGVATPPAGEPQTKTLPNGAVALRLPLSQLETAVVRVGAGGELEQSCVDGFAEAARLSTEPRDVTTPAGPAVQ